MTAIIYHYSPITHEFTGSSTADKDPVDGLTLIPAMATAIKPPATVTNKVAVFSANSWSLIDDYRGWTGFDAAGAEEEITEIGIVPNSAWTTTRPFILADAKNSKYNEIRAAFKISAELAVTDANGITWNGGFDSGLKIDAANRMAAMAGSTVVSLFDVTNVEHILSLANAEVVVLTIGQAYQIKLAQKQALMRAITALPVTATQADIDGI